MSSMTSFLAAALVGIGGGVFVWCMMALLLIAHQMAANNLDRREDIRMDILRERFGPDPIDAQWRARELEQDRRNRSRS